MSSRFYETKLLFNITAADHAALNEMRAKMKIEKSEFIRQAIRCYVAEKRVEFYKSGLDIP